MQTNMSSTKGISFTKLVRQYLTSLEDTEQARIAVSVARKLEQPEWTVRDLEFHAARLQTGHRQAVVDLVSRAVEMREQGTA